MKNNITYWLKRMIFLVLILVQVGSVYGAVDVEARTEVEGLEVADGHDKVKAWEGLKGSPDWVRLNTELLERIVEKGHDINKVKELYQPNVMKLPPSLKPPYKPPGFYEGIEFDKFGFPKLEPHVSNPNHVVKIEVDGTNGDYIKAYNKLKDIIGEGNIQFTNQYGSSFRIKQNGQWSEPYTWHHHQDGESMMPVLQKIHQSIQNYHTGGRATQKRGLVGLFNPPKFQ